MALQFESGITAPADLFETETVDGETPAADTLTAGRFEIVLHRTLSAAEAEWRSLEKDAGGLPYQEFGWIEAWQATIGQDLGVEPVLVIARENGRFAFALPLGLEKRPACTVLTILGQTSNNQNIGLWSPDCYQTLTGSSEIEKTLTAVCGHVGADLVHLANIPVNWHGKTPPLLLKHRVQSPSPVYIGTVGDDFEALFQQSFGKRSGKTLLRKQRKLEAAGDFRILRARTKDDIRRGLNAFIEQRIAREKQSGIPSGCTTPEKQQFLASLVGLGPKGSFRADKPPMDVWILEAGGAIRAAYLALWNRDRMISYSTSISQDQLTAQSPGIVLLKGIIEAACQDPAIRVLDLGLGDEFYKHAWSEPQEVNDCFLAVSPRGWLALTLIETRQGLKTLIRNSPALWKMIRKLRQFRSQLKT
jgi:CelD/BcsL family acetyltransferase involved in cellulose biosynthesis